MITLISPRLPIQKADFLGSGVPYWPTELAVFASFLKQQNESVSVIDLFGSNPRALEERTDHFLQGVSLQSVLQSKAITDATAFIVFAISSMSHSELVSIVKALKQQSNKPLFVLENSQAVTAYAVDHKAADFFQAGADGLICGEPYFNWPEIRAFLFSPAALRPTNVLSNSTTEKPVRLTDKTPSYPVPAWELFPYQNYWSLPYSHGPKTKTYFPIFTSRGCPYPCDFCVVPETNHRLWRGRAAEAVVAEMLELKQRFGVADFQIEDLNPTVSKTRTQAICEQLIQQKADIRFYIVSGTKAETVGLDQVELLARAGCRYLSISPESGSSAVMKAIGKPFDYEHGAHLIKKCREIGISTQACFVVGHPEETAADHQASKNYLRRLVRLGLDEVAIFVLAPLPGSALFQRDRIDVNAPEKMISFSPKGRSDWQVLSGKRSDLIRVFFIEKLKRGTDLFLQGLRALFRVPRTKMENLPWRVVYVYAMVIICRMRSLLKAPVSA